MALSPSVTTLTIADPLVGFYYSLKQGGAVTNLAGGELPQAVDYIGGVSGGIDAEGDPMIYY